MKKAFKVALTLFLVVLVAIVLILNFFGGRVIRHTVNVAGPLALGVPVTLEEADFRLLRGFVKLNGLKVGNPEGYKTDSLFEVDELLVDLDTRSLLGGVVHIRKIAIDGPRITYERGLTASNLSDLLEGLEKGEKTEEKPADKPEEKKVAPAEEGGGVKVIIDEIDITGARLKVSLTVAQGLSAPIPLPPINLVDIGKETGGAGVMEIITRIIRAILGTVTNVITGSAKLLGDGAVAVGGAAVDGVAAVGGAAVDGAAAVGGAAVDGAKAVGKGAAVVGGAAVDGVAAVGGAAVGGVKAVGKGVGAVAGGIGNLIGLGDKEKEQEKEEPAPEPAAAAP